MNRRVHSRGRVLVLLKGRRLGVLLRNELEQGSCHGWANVPVGLGFRAGLLRSEGWRWSQRRGRTLLAVWRNLVLPGHFSFRWRTI